MNEPLLIELSHRTAPIHRVAQAARLALSELRAQLTGLSRRTMRQVAIDRVDALSGLMHELLAETWGSDNYREAVERARTEAHDAALVIRTVPLGSLDIAHAASRLTGIGRALDRARDLAPLVGDGPGVATLPPARPFALSGDRPRLHYPDRAPLKLDLPAPHIDEAQPAAVTATVLGPSLFDELATDPDLDASFDEEIPAHKRLDVLGTPSTQANEPSSEGRVGERAHLLALARESLEEINACANLRRLEPDEPYDWNAMRGFEHRMMSSLDALLCLAEPYRSNQPGAPLEPGLDVLKQAVTYGDDALTVDPGRAFARAFVLGSVAGEDSARVAIALAKRAAPETHRALARALSIAPNEAIASALLDMLRTDEPALIGLALDALYARGQLPLADLVPLTEHGHHDVRVRAVRTLGASMQPDGAKKVLAEIIETDIDDDVVQAAVSALVALGDERAVSCARERLRENAEEPGSIAASAMTDFMLLLGCHGATGDHGLLASNYDGRLGQASALGFHGHVALIETLLESFSADERPPARLLGPLEEQQAARALIRITGAPLYATPQSPSRYAPSVDGRAWHAWWAEHRERFDDKLRYRFGEPYAAAMTIEELRRNDVPMSIRTSLATELGLVFGKRPIMLHAFAAEQSDALNAAHDALETRAAAEVDGFR